MNTRMRKVSMVAAAVLALLPLSLVTAGGASATTRQCASSATIIRQSSTGSLIWYDSQKARNGAPYRAHTLPRGGARWWELHGGRTLTLAFGGDRFDLSGNAIFALTCSGVSKAQGAIMPTITVLQGTIVVHTTRTVLGAIFAEEGLIGPVTSNPAMVYTVTRVTTQKNLTPNQKFSWLANYTNQPAGTLTARTDVVGKLINVTPYVGPRIGSCRHVKSAVLHTTSVQHGWSRFVF